MHPTPTDIARFQKNFSQETDDRCWSWTGCICSNGYGGFKMCRTWINSHRAAWIIYRGAIPKGLWVLHKCDNRKCVNPDHLFFGTIKDNIADMVAKRRHAFGERHNTKTHPELIIRGEKHPLAKLNEERIKEIRAKRNSGSTLTRLASEYGVCLAKIHQIVTRKSWAHVP